MMQPVQSVTLIEGRLLARVYEHELETAEGVISCVTCVSEGFGEAGERPHPELVFCTRVPEGGDVSGAVEASMRLFEAIFPIAAEGHVTQAGELTEFRASGAKMERVRAALYTPCQRLGDVPLRGDELLGVFLMGEELEVVRAFGALRLMARLGRAVQQFPCPMWSDLAREEVSMQSFRGSLLGQVPRVFMDSASVWWHDKDVTLVLGRQEAEGRISHMQRQYAERAAAQDEPLPIALLPAPSPSPDAALVWDAEQRATEAISASDDAQRIGGSFLMLVPYARDEGVIMEDGFAFNLSPPAWTALWDALRDGQDVSVETSGLTLHVRWFEQVRRDPMTNAVLFQRWGWASAVEAVAPGEARQDDPTRHVVLDHVELLSPQEVIARTVGVEALTALIHQLVDVAEVAVAGSVYAPFEAVLRVELEPDGALVPQLAIRPDQPKALIQRLFESTQQVDPPEVDEPIAMQLFLRIKPVGGLGRRLD